MTAATPVAAEPGSAPSEPAALEAAPGHPPPPAADHPPAVCAHSLKPENLLLESEADDARVKIADFGMARDIYRADYYRYS